MIGVVVDNEVIAAAIPAPIGSQSPIPRGNFKRKTAGKPEPVMIAIEALDVIAIRRTKMFEVPVLIRVSDGVALVVRAVVAVPVIVVDVRSAVHAAAFAVLDFGFGVRIAMRRGSLGDVPLVRVQVVVVFLWMSFGMLSEHR